MIRVLILAVAFASNTALATSITDLNTWTQIVDPADPGMTGVIDSSVQATLSASGAVPSGTDIGYATINGPDVSGSTAGFYFDPTSNFSIAIDYEINSLLSAGAGGIGLGIGEDTAGENSAGVGVGFVNGGLFTASGAGRINNVDAVFNPPQLSPVGSAGRLFVEYSPGSIIGGHNPTPGSAAAVTSFPIPITSANWNGEDLFVSFFLRSQAVSPFPALTSGDIDAVFSNFEVLSGTPVSVIPEPTTATLTLVVGLLVRFRRR